MYSSTPCVDSRTADPHILPCHGIRARSVRRRRGVAPGLARALERTGRVGDGGVHRDPALAPVAEQRDRRGDAPARPDLRPLRGAVLAGDRPRVVTDAELDQQDAAHPAGDGDQPDRSPPGRRSSSAGSSTPIDARTTLAVITPRGERSRRRRDARPQHDRLRADRAHRSAARPGDRSARRVARQRQRVRGRPVATRDRRTRRPATSTGSAAREQHRRDRRPVGGDVDGAVDPSLHRRTGRRRRPAPLLRGTRRGRPPAATSRRGGS